MCRDVLASRELLCAAHLFCGTPTMKKKVNGTGHAYNTHALHKIAKCNNVPGSPEAEAGYSERFQVSRSEFYNEG